MNRLHNGPNPLAGTFTPNKVVSSGSLPSFSMDPQTPIGAGQDLQSSSSSTQVDWSHGNSAGLRDGPARHISSFSEPNERQIYSTTRGFSPNHLATNRFSSPRDNGRKSVLDDPRSRGSPLKPIQGHATNYHSKGQAKKTSQGHPCIGNGGRHFMNRHCSEPSRHPGDWSTGSTNFSDSPVPLYNQGFVYRPEANGGASTSGWPQEDPHPTISNRYPQGYHQACPISSQAPDFAPIMSLHDDSFGPFVPSHSSSSNQSFYKAQASFQVDNDAGIPQPNFFEPYASNTVTPGHTTPQPQVNPYAQDASSLAGSAYYQGSGGYPQQQVIVRTFITRVLLTELRFSTISTLR